MTVMELNYDQLTELKQRMVDDEIYTVEGRGASYGELVSADELVTDEKIEEAFGSTEFVEEDFG